MTTTEGLAQLEDILGRLMPISDAQPGERIESQAWNTLVGAMVEMARAVYTPDDAAIEHDHDHIERVKLSWLDPNLRTLVERGPTGAPDVLGRITELERRVDQLTRMMREQQADLRNLRDSLGDLVRKDLIRERDVTVVRRSVEGIADPRAEIGAMRESLRAISNSVNVAVDLAERLGGDFDARALEERLSDLETLRSRLTTPEGDLLDATRLETRLTELTNTLVTEDELDTALESRLGGITIDDGLEDRLRTELMANLNTTLSQSITDLQNNVNRQLSGVPAIAARAVSDALPDVRASLLETTRNEIATAIDASEQRTTNTITTRLSRLETDLRDDYTARIAEAQTGVTGTVRTELEAALPEHLADITRRMDTLDSRATSINNRVSSLDQTLSGRINEITTRQGTFERRMEERITDQFTEFDDRLGDLFTRFRQDVRTENAAALQDLERNMTTVATNVANSMVSGVTQQLRGEMRTIARNEVNANREGIATTVREEVDAATANIPNLVNREVRTNTANLSGLVRREVEGMRPVIDTMVNDRVRRTANDLTLIEGLTRTDISRLRAANVTTAADLAGMTPQSVASLLNTPVQRLIEADVIGQAQRLSRG